MFKKKSISVVNLQANAGFGPHLSPLSRSENYQNEPAHVPFNKKSMSVDNSSYSISGPGLSPFPCSNECQETVEVNFGNKNVPVLNLQAIEQFGPHLSPLSYSENLQVNAGFGSHLSPLSCSGNFQNKPAHVEFDKAFVSYNGTLYNSSTVEEQCTLQNRNAGGNAMENGTVKQEFAIVGLLLSPINPNAAKPTSPIIPAEFVLPSGKVSNSNTKDILACAFEETFGEMDDTQRIDSSISVPEDMNFDPRCISSENRDSILDVFQNLDTFCRDPGISFSFSGNKVADSGNKIAGSGNKIASSGNKIASSGNSNSSSVSDWKSFLNPNFETGDISMHENENSQKYVCTVQTVNIDFSKYEFNYEEIQEMEKKAPILDDNVEDNFDFTKSKLVNSNGSTNEVLGVEVTLFD